jgi:hypothetical protein
MMGLNLNESQKKAAKVGIAGAAILIVASMFKYLIRDVLPNSLNLDLGYDFASILSFSTYCLSIALGLAVGCGAVWIFRTGAMSIRSAVIFSAIAGIALGAVDFIFQVIYDLVFRPFIVGYSYSALDALITILYSGVDIAVMTGLAIAGGGLYTVFVIKPDAVLVETQIKG